MKNTEKRLIITDYKRFGICCMSVILMIVTAITVFASKPTSANNIPSETTVYVEHGDTLWSIASANNPKKIDVRVLIDEIKTYNKMTSVTIHPGQKIAIPY